MKNVVCVALLMVNVVLPSCSGYRFGGYGMFSSHTTVDVPYVEGDSDGRLTAALVRELATRGVAVYSNSGAEHFLAVRFVDFADENIGFRYDRDKNNVILNDVVQREGRARALIEISVIESATGEAVWGPKSLGASIDYDYGLGNSSENLLSYSLGQLDTAEVASDSALDSLYRALAKKIVDYVNYVW